MTQPSAWLVRAIRLAAGVMRILPRRSLLIAPLLATGAVALAGCGGISDNMGSFWVNPARYSVYHCDQLAEEAKDLAKREKELRDLMSRASEGAGGTVIGTLTYRSDYQTVLEQEKLLNRTAAEKNCQPATTTTYTSDQIIR